VSCVIDTEWLEARIAKTKVLIEAYEDAILSLSSGAVLQYSLDTGQTRQTVTKQQIGSLRLVLDELENRLSTLEARLCGASTRIVPNW
jgi:hypothetical protein